MTRSRTCGRTPGRPWMTLSTTPRDTPASSAILLMVTFMRRTLPAIYISALYHKKEPWHPVLDAMACFFLYVISDQYSTFTALPLWKESVIA